MDTESQSRRLAKESPQKLQQASSIEEQLKLTSEERASRNALAKAGLLELLEVFASRIEIPVFMRQVWQGLTDEERAGSGADVTMSTLYLWMQVRNIPDRYYALVDLAQEHGQFARPVQRRLWHAIGKFDSDREKSVSGKARRPAIKPKFDRATGRLYYGGKEIKKVRLQSNPSDLQRILNSFNAARWVRSVNNPLNDERDPDRIYKAVYRLNEGLAHISFHVANSGSQIYWEKA